MIDVVSACIVEQGRIFLTQRLPDKDYPWAFECPGGAVEAGESHAEALMREVDEEIGCKIARIASQHFWDKEFVNQAIKRPERRHIKLHMYHVDLLPDSKPFGREGQGFGWFNEREFRAITLAPGNEAALPSILSLLRKS